MMENDTIQPGLKGNIAASLEMLIVTEIRLLLFNLLFAVFSILDQFPKFAIQLQ